MNINGRNGLACTTAIEDLSGEIRITPLPHMDVIKDLVPDFTHFYAAICLDPALAEDEDAAAVRRAAAVAGGPREAGRPLRVHPLRLLLDLLPELLVECRPVPGPGDPAPGLSLARRQPRRGPASGSTSSTTPSALYRCHTIMNCANVCPKGLNPAKAIAETKKLELERAG
jgi:succinate dehydrogenase / fumarate reductase iron-sulfur subunit